MAEVSPCVSVGFLRSRFSKMYGRMGTTKPYKKSSDMHVVSGVGWRGFHRVKINVPANSAMHIVPMMNQVAERHL